MFDTLLKYLIRVGMFTAVLAALYGVGAVVNALVPWTWLTNIFVIFRHLVALLNWFLDVNTLLALIGLSIGLQVSIRFYRLSVRVFNYFTPNH